MKKIDWSKHFVKIKDKIVNLDTNLYIIKFLNKVNLHKWNSLFINVHLSNNL